MTIVVIVAGLVAFFDLGLRFADFIAGGDITATTAIWLSVCFLLSFTALSITVRWVLLNWGRLTRSVEARVDARYKALIEESKDYFFIVQQGEVIYASPSAASAYGPGNRDLSDVLAKLRPQDRALLEAAVHDPARATSAFDVHFEDEDDDTKVIHQLTVNDQTANPSVEGVIVTGRDVTPSRQLEKQLADMALKDELTKLPNRWALNNWMAEALARSERTNSVTALLLIDLDGFKGVNDTLGHPFGDRLLRSVAGRLAGVCRRNEGLARLGGDEFAIVVENLEDDQQALKLAHRVIEDIRAPITIDGHIVAISATVGIAKSTESSSADELFQHADIALYDAKARGRSEVAVFRTEMATLVESQTRLVQEIDTGLRDGDFHLVFQPLVDLIDRQTVAFESLLRWNSPSMGEISPMTFIPVAERTGAILPLGRWVFEESCRLLASWTEADNGRPLKMSINVSVLQLDDPDFLGEVMRIMERTGVNPNQIQIEVTESVLADDPQLIAGRLQTLRTLGIKVAIDDFGTGYSSMAQLRLFPVDVIKIDQGFVSGLDPDDPQGPSLLKALIDMARAMDAEVVAEGVETDEQRELLARLGVDVGQGYLFSHPLAPGDVPLYLAAGRLLTRSNVHSWSSVLEEWANEGES